MSNLCFEKFKRGQIWNVKRSSKDTSNGIRDKNNHIAEKTRPWLIISNDISNRHSPILNCVPMTSRVSSLPPHIPVNMEIGVCDIQCEQIKTLNKSDFDNAVYIGTLTEENMQKIEIALANQLGLSIQFPSLETLEALIEKIANAKAQEMKRIDTQVTDEYVTSLASKLESIFNIPTSNTVSIENSAKSIKPEIVTVVEKADSDNNHDDIKKEENNSKKSKNKKPKGIRQNIKWTPELMRAFIKDSETLSTEEMSKKYNMGIKTIYNNKYRFKTILGEK